MGGAERPVKMHFHKSRLPIHASFSGCKVIDRFFNGFAYRTHSNDYMLRIAGAIIMEKLIVCSDFLINNFHIRLY